MHNVYVKDKNNSQEIPLLWLVREPQYAFLVIIDKDYWGIIILIFTKMRDKLRTGLKSYSILKDTWNPASIDIEIFMLVKKNFVDFIMRIIQNNKGKVNINFSLCDESYLFTYYVKTNELRQFPDLEIFYINIFQIFTSIAIEMQLEA